MPDELGPIRVSAVVLRDDRGQILTVRKRDTLRFMLPGGKPERHETAAQAAVREVAEELGLDLAEDALCLLGSYAADAANESGRLVAATVFEHPMRPESAAPAAEIAEVRWLAPGDEPDDLAPLLAQHVLPALRRDPDRA